MVAVAATNPLSWVAVCRSTKWANVAEEMEGFRLLASIGAIAVMVMVPLKPEHCAMNGWLVSVSGNMLLGGSIIGGLSHQLTDAGETDVGMELNCPVAVNCAWPAWAFVLAGLTVRDWSWRLLPPHPETAPTARINTTKRRLHSLFMHSSGNLDAELQASLSYSKPDQRLV